MAWAGMTMHLRCLGVERGQYRRVENAAGPTETQAIRFYLAGEPTIEANAKGHSAGESTRQSGGTAASVCGERPKEQPILQTPALRAVMISTSESPTISVSSAVTPASRISVSRPSGSGFLVAKLLPP